MAPQASVGAHVGPKPRLDRRAEAFEGRPPVARGISSRAAGAGAAATINRMQPLSDGRLCVKGQTAGIERTFKMDLIQKLEQEEIKRLNRNIPEFVPGDTV